MDLASCAGLELDELDALQVDILEAFDFVLPSASSGPRAILDELWIALPQLRGLVRSQSSKRELISEFWNMMFRTIVGEMSG